MNRWPGVLQMIEYGETRSSIVKEHPTGARGQPMDEQWREDFLRLFLSGQSDQVDVAFELKLKHTPSSLYKFYSPSEYAFEGLASGTLWLASPNTCNDPFDSGITMDIPAAMGDLVEFVPGAELEKLKAFGLSTNDIKGLISGQADQGVADRLASAASGVEADDVRRLISLVPELLKRMAAPLVTSMQAVSQGGLKITCFTEEATNVLLWAHYAASHTGFCVRYPIDVIPPDLPQRRLLFPVFYRAERFDLAPTLRAFASGKLSAPIHGIAAALFKSRDWAYEREWRIINPDGRQTPGLTVPMSTPTVVYAGMKMSPSDRNKLAQVCSEREIPLREVSMSTIRYELVL